MPFHQPNMDMISRQAAEAKSRAERTGGGQNGDNDFKEKFDVGDTVMRFAPPWNELGLTALQVVKWWVPKDINKGKDGGNHMLISPEMTYPHAGIQDPILAIVVEFKNKGLSDDVIRKIARKDTGWYMNAWIRDADRRGITRMKPFIVNVPKGVYNWLAQAMADRRFGWILDPYMGWDININRVGKGFNDTKYTASLMPNAFTNGPGPIVQDPQEVEKLAGLIHNLHLRFPCYQAQSNTGDAELDKRITTKYKEMFEAAQKVRDYCTRMLGTMASMSVMPGYVPPGMNPPMPGQSGHVSPPGQNGPPVPTMQPTPPPAVAPAPVHVPPPPMMAPPPSQMMAPPAAAPVAPPAPVVPTPGANLNQFIGAPPTQMAPPGHPTFNPAGTQQVPPAFRPPAPPTQFMPPGGVPPTPPAPVTQIAPQTPVAPPIQPAPAAQTPVKEGEQGSDPTQTKIPTNSQDWVDRAVQTAFNPPIPNSDVLEVNPQWLRCRLPDGKGGTKERYFSRSEPGVFLKTQKGIEKRILERANEPGNQTQAVINQTRAEVATPVAPAIPTPPRPEPPLPGQTANVTTPTEQRSAPAEIGALAGAPSCYFNKDMPNETGFLVISKMPDPAHPTHPPGTKCRLCPFEIPCKSAAENYQATQVPVAVTN